MNHPVPDNEANGRNTDAGKGKGIVSDIFGGGTVNDGPTVVVPAAQVAVDQQTIVPSSVSDGAADFDGDPEPTSVNSSSINAPTLKGQLAIQVRPARFVPLEDSSVDAESLKDTSNGNATPSTDEHTFLIPTGKVAQEPGATVIGPQEVKDSEDYFETLPGDEPGKGKGSVKGSIVGDYQVLGELGRGGMGVVYKAKHRKLNRVVALKMILTNKHSGNDALQRFIAEARAVAKLQHPGIVQIFDIGEHDGLPYFSLEFVDGKDLHKDLNGLPRDAKRSAEMVEQLCIAMQYAHDNKILHRDLKPANILLDKDGKPKISDFGLAKSVDGEGSTATNDGTIMGSPSYMPPEQARGENSSMTPRSDLYSLGAILYQMLTARPPFVSERPLDTVLQVISNEPVAPGKLQPGIPVDIETICMKAMQKEPTARYGSCQDLAADLRRFINGEPILARPVSRLERAWRWCKRNPKVAIPSTLASVFIVATAVISSWAWMETSAQASVIAAQKDTVEKERDEANRQRDIADEQKQIALANEVKAKKEKDEADRQRTIANQQRVLAEEKEELARKQANLALQNIQFVVTEIDGSLKKQPGSNDLRISILEAVSKKWDELDVELTGGIRGEAIPTLMTLRHKIARAFYEMDKLEIADKEFEKLYKMGEERLEIKGRTDAARTNLAKIAMFWAPVKKRLGSDPEASRKLNQSALALVRETIKNPVPEKDSPTQNQILELLASILQNEGVDLMEQGRLRETAVLFQEALDSTDIILTNIRSEPGFSELTDDQKDAKTANLEITRDKSALGLAYIVLRLGEPDRAVTLYEKVMASRRDIFKRRPTMLPLKLELAGHSSLYAQSLIWLNQLDKAEPLAVEAMKLFEELHAADPEKADYKRQLTTSIYRLATLRDLQGHAGESLSLFERCRLLRAELFAGSPDEKNSINLMLAEARVGNVEAAVKLIEQLGASEKKNGELHLERARALAQLSRKAEGEQKTKFTDDALTAVERSVAEGFSDPFRVKVENDLTPLHDTDRFRAAVGQLEAARAATPNP